ncbi:MAG: hypothetical protein KFF73_01935, partial [Cyclobacteriaceae bacterium]|nr:hypothetical protein [Cyclobacteriaceae bacterium]
MKALIIFCLAAMTVAFISIDPQKNDKNAPLSLSAKKIPGRTVKVCGSINLEYLNDETEAPLFQGLGNHFYKVSTESPAAQKYFNQGLTLVYGFNHMEALRSFKQS